MRNPIGIFILLISITCFGQSEISLLKSSGKTLEEIKPKGWKILDSKTGDINGDDILDLVFAIQDTKKENIQLNEGLGNDSIDLNPRILGIYFGSQSGGFIKKLVSDKFIILHDTPTMEEPFEGFFIDEKGHLSIEFKFWYSAGSWQMSDHKYKFRYHENDFVLIGYNSNETNRSTGETTEYNINFLTKNMQISKSNYTNDEEAEVAWRKFKLDKPFTLTSLKKPFETDFEGIFL